MFLWQTPQAVASADPGHDFWFSSLGAGGQRTISGALVNPDTALQLSTVYKCVKVLAETVSMLPRHMYEDGSARQRVTNHPVARLLSVAPNRWQTPLQFFGMLEAHKELRGNAYAEIFYNRRGQVSELVPLHPDRVKPEIGPNGVPRWKVRDMTGGNERTLVQGEIMHAMAISLDGYTGVNPVIAERESLGGAIASRDYGLRYWANDAKPPFWIKVPAKFADNETRTAFRDDWQASYGGANQHRPAVLDRGMELVEMRVDNDTAQWMEARRYSDTDICGLWRMPPHKIGILTDAKYANIEQQSIEFVTDTILPQLIGWEQIIARDLLGPDSGLYVEFLVGQLLRGDTASRYAAYGKGIQDGWLTRNEARRLENLPPLDGLDEPLQPLNMARASAAANLPGAQQHQPSGARASAMLHANAERVVRKELAILRAIGKPLTPQSVQAAFAQHGRFVSSVMAVSDAAAAQYTQHATEAAIHALANTAHPISESDWSAQQIAALMRLEP